MKLKYQLYKTTLVSLLFALSIGGSLQADSSQEHDTKENQSSSQVSTDKLSHVSKHSVYIDSIIIVAGIAWALIRVGLADDTKLGEWKATKLNGKFETTFADGNKAIMKSNVFWLFVSATVVRAIYYYFLQDNKPKQGKKK